MKASTPAFHSSFDLRIRVCTAYRLMILILLCKGVLISSSANYRCHGFTFELSDQSFILMSSSDGLPVFEAYA